MTKQWKVLYRFAKAGSWIDSGPIYSNEQDAMVAAEDLVTTLQTQFPEAGVTLRKKSVKGEKVEPTGDATKTETPVDGPKDGEDSEKEEEDSGSEQETDDSTGSTEAQEEEVHYGVGDLADVSAPVGAEASSEESHEESSEGGVRDMFGKFVRRR